MTHGGFGGYPVHPMFGMFGKCVGNKLAEPGCQVPVNQPVLSVFGWRITHLNGGTGRLSGESHFPGP